MRGEGLDLLGLQLEDGLSQSGGGTSGLLEIVIKTIRLLLHDREVNVLDLLSTEGR